MVVHLADVDEHRVSARDHERDVGRVRLPVREEVGPDVPFQMVHPDQGRPGREGDGLRGRHPHEQGTDQPRTDGDGNAVEAPEPDTGLVERAFEQRIQRLDVRSSGDLGDDAAVALVEMLLPGDQVRADLGAVFHDRDRRLVARCLDAEGDHAGRTPSGRLSSMSSSRRRYASVRTSSVHMMSASSLTSW